MRTVRFNLTVSILALLSCLLLLAWLLFSLTAFRTAENDLYSQKGEHARMLLATFISQLPEKIPTYPEGMITSSSPAAIYAQKLAEEESFIRLTLLDSAGKVIYTIGREASDVYRPFAGLAEPASGSFVLPEGAGMVCISQVSRGNAAVAKAGLVLSLEAEKARLKRSRQLLLTYFAVDFILLLGIGAYILSRIVVRPVNRLLAATEKIIDGHYGQRVRITGSLELARLAQSFNEMSETLLNKDQQVNAHVAALEKANAEIGLAREEALRSEKMASIGLLAAGMAHEIGTPLASIMGYAELMSGEPIDTLSCQDYTKRIIADCSRIDRIVQGLLDYSRPRRQSAEATDIIRLVERSVELLTQQGAFKQILLRSWFEDGLPMVQTDPHQLQQVLINLMLNSRDALPQGGKIAIRGMVEKTPALPCRSGCVRIEVMDDGCGIPEDQLKMIFEPFFTTKEPGKGTGLGLAISARIIESFGGRISVKSKPGKGSCFILWLPISAVEGNK